MLCKLLSMVRLKECPSLIGTHFQTVQNQSDCNMNCFEGYFFFTILMAIVGLEKSHFPSPLWLFPHVTIAFDNSRLFISFISHIFQPPKELYIQIRVLVPSGDIMTDNGPVTLSSVGDTLFLRRYVIYSHDGYLEVVIKILQKNQWIPML
jgi:hypothetical protein